MFAFRSRFIACLALRSAALILITALAGASGGSAAATNPPAITLSQIPLTVAIPAHPQVLFAIANSQSTDGNLAGAIQTGSGAAGTELQTSSSPLNYTIPAGFTPPLFSNSDGVTAPYNYTTTVSGTSYTADNSPSRLNEAKAGIAAILNTYLPVADFALADYSASPNTQICTNGLCNTWVYYMSPTSANFTFTNTPPQPSIILSLTTSVISSGQSTTLSWSPTFATSCTGSGGTFVGSQSANGGFITVNPTSTTTYTLSCTNTSGTTVQSTTLSVGGGSTVTLAVGPGTISSGGSATLNWFATGNPASCTAAGGTFAGTQVAGGTLSVSPTTTTTYSLTCGTNTQTTVLTVGAGARVVANPCYGINTSGSTQVDSDCNTLKSHYGGTSITTFQYMTIGASSDDPSINDVLYGNPQAPIFINYGPTSTGYTSSIKCNPASAAACPVSPYSYFSLGNYESGSVGEQYANGLPAGVGTETGPTNAGYVPYSMQVMYSQRGFGYIASATSNSGSMVVGSATSGSTNPPQIISATQTPTTASLTAALKYFGLALNPSTPPTPGTPLAPETNSASTGEIKATAEQSPIAGLLAEALTYYKAKPPTSNGCPSNPYVVLLTDGLPTEDLSGNNWPPLGSQSAAASPNGYGVFASYNANGSITSTTSSASNNDQALLDTITSLNSLLTATTSIKTYVIGLGAVADPAVNPSQFAASNSALTAMAIAGGTNSYFAATSAAALTADLQQILQAIIGTNQSISSAAVNSTGLNTGTTLYQAEFSTQDTYQDWTGSVNALSVNSSTGAPSSTPTWSAQTQLDSIASSSRLIATWQPATTSGIPFEWVSCSTPPCITGIAASSALGTALTSTTILPSASDANGTDRLNYLRGNTSLEQRNGGTFRNRSHILGDIVDSSPLYVGAPNGPYEITSYFTFEQNNQTRQPVIYVGANDGMLHAFNANSGNEMFAFIPNGVFNNLPKLTSPFYNSQHQFFVDGSPQEGDALFTDGNWHSVLVGGENAGGSTIYALDVTNPTGISSESALASEVLWEFSDTSNLGNTYGTPVIAQIASSTTTPAFAVFFGNGYDSATGQPFLYALNPQTGTVIAKINLCAAVTTACSSSTSNGLSSVAVVNSSGALAAPADTVYAGDLQGNMWRINISSNNPANWSAAGNVTVLFQAEDSSGNPQPITQPPQVSLNPAFPQLFGNIVLFGTGELLSLGDLSTTQTQTMYGIYDPNLGKTYTRTNLVQQTLTLGSTTTTSGATDATLTASGNPVNLNTSNGWYADLSFQSGLRDVTPPVLENGGVLVTTLYSPNANQCTGGGSGFILLQNFATGGGFNTGQFLLPGNTSINSTAGNVIGMSLGSVYAAAVTVIDRESGGGSSSGGGTTGKRLKFAPLSNTQILQLNETGPSQARSAWWELQ